MKTWWEAERIYEFLKKFDNILLTLNIKLDIIISKLKHSVELTKHLSDKELGLFIQNNPKSVGDIAKRFIFLARKNNLFDKIKEKGFTRTRFFQLIRPKANIIKKNYE
jgi:hypothetical protein